MGIEMNSTLSTFVNWASQANIGETNLVHAKTAKEANGGRKITMLDNTRDGIGYFASRRRSDDLKNMNNATRELFMKAVMKLFNATTIDGVPKSVRDKMKLADYGGKGRPLSAHRIRTVATAIQDALAAKAFNVSGKGEATAAFKGVINAKLNAMPGTKKENMITLKSDMDRIAKNRFNMFFAEDMKDLQTGQESQFEKDEYRIMFVPRLKVGNETLTFNSGTPFDEKKDIIAKFVMKNNTAKFTDLQGADLNKAYAVMAIMSQHFGICMLDGVVRGLAPDLNEAPLQIGNERHRTADISTLEMSFDEDGSLHVHYDDVRDAPNVNQYVGDETIVYTQHAPGSSVTITTDMEITAQEFEKISNMDYSGFDYNVPQAAMDTVEHDQSEAGAAAMGQFRFGDGATFSVSCTAVFNGGLKVD